VYGILGQAGVHFVLFLQSCENLAESRSCFAIQIYVALVAHYMPCLMYVLHILHARSKSQQHTVSGSHCFLQSQE
jgi:hypothetical protein